MSEESKQEIEEPERRRSHELAGKLSSVGWALFLIWIGIAFLANLGFGVGLLGVGVITLGVQAARRFCGLKLEGLWVVIGLLFVVGGLWEVFELRLPLVPVVLIVAGLALLVSVFRSKHPKSK